MKPVKLRMTAFGPYKMSETIDFADLKGNQLFVISGSTGSGKTTIFDAISFALYGSASGSDRSEARNLRSDFADDDTHTSVEMEFEIHRKTYRVLRQMSHVKAGNKSPTGERFEFFEITETGEVPCVERQIVSEINRKVEELLGLTQNQFSQIVMLPQGEFRKLLTSETDNKEEILRKIFKTEPYKMISERLKVKKDAAAKAHDIEKRMLDSHITGIASALPVRQSELFDLIGRDHVNIHQLLEALKNEKLFYDEKVLQDEQRYQAAFKKHGEKQGTYYEAKKWNDRIAELEVKERRLTELNSQLASIEEQEHFLHKSQRASLIEGMENLFKELQQTEAEKIRLFAEAQKAEQEATKALATAESSFARELNQEDQRNEVQRQLIQLENLVPTVQELATKQEELLTLEAEVRKITLDEKKAEAAWQAERGVGKNLEADIALLEKKLETFDEKQATLLALNEQCRVLVELTVLEKTKQQQSIENQGKKIAYESALKEYKMLESSWFGNQAQVLAAALRDGEACPVCGSTDHPIKKSGMSHEEVPKDRLDQAKARFDGVDEEYRNALAKANATEEQLVQKRRAVAELGLAADKAQELQTQLEQRRHALDNEVKALLLDKKQLRTWKERLTENAATVHRLEADKTELARNTQVQTSTLETAKAIFEQRLLSIPEETRTMMTLNEKIRNTSATKQQLDHNWEQAQKDLQHAKEQYSSAVIVREHRNEAAEEIRLKKDKALQNYYEALEKSEFESEASYQNAKLSEAKREELQKSTQQYRQTLHTALQQTKELQIELAGKAKVDLSLLENEMGQLKVEYETAFGEWNQTKELKAAVVGLTGKITQASGKTLEAEQQMNRITDLHDMIRGQNNLKISFERYLQIEYLEQIIQSANERLKNLSNGQFNLMRSDRQEARGKQSGLGLDVYDAYTGQTRDVKTMSGGEKFNASLCLALGMADVIQSFQGNVSIDTMFIDEGFGSLDEESLNKAIDTLIDLQKSGRIIGVISHVQELKAAIPAILEVHKSKEGYSTTKFVIK